jgi:hypothetical protein
MQSLFSVKDITAKYITEKIVTAKNVTAKNTTANKLLQTNYCKSFRFYPHP